MSEYYISKQRLVLEYEYNLKRRSAGTLNWYVYEENNKLVLKIMIDIHDVTYIYKQEVVDKDSISPDVAMMLDHKKSIIGEEEVNQKRFNVQFASPLPGEEQ